MKTHKRIVRNRYMTPLAAALLTLASAQTHAAPGSLSQVPLFLAQGVQPNIFFLLDNSGSMDWEVLMTEGAIAIYNDGENRGNLTYQPGTDIQNNLEHCVGYNAMAFDPTKTYTPWYGEDTNGNDFVDQTVTAARVNPYEGGASTEACATNVDVDPRWWVEVLEFQVNNDGGRVCNLTTAFDDAQVSGKTGAFYYKWNDDGDGVYEDGECSDDGNDTIDVNDRIYISDMTTEEDKTNFANWFSYYRKREYVMKRAVSEIIAKSRDRLGLGVLNTESSNLHVTGDHQVGTPVKDMDDLTMPINATAVANKETLLDNLLGVDSNRGTALRRNLEAVGEYFSNSMSGSELFGRTLSSSDATNSAAGYSPILNADLGGTCQQNFVVLLSDGFWNGTAPGVGNSDGTSSTDNIFDEQSYADSVSNTLADVAMDIYKGDLLTNLDNKVPAVAIPKGSDSNVACYDTEGNKTQECFDTNDAQHLVTFTVSFGIDGTIPEKDASGNECIPKNRTDSLADQKWPSSCGAGFDGWPTPVANTNTTADDMKHAAWNGRGRFLSAKVPDELINKMQQAISEISERKPAAAAAVAVNTFNMINGGNFYLGRFDATDWSGQIYAMEFTGGAIGSVVWGAHTELETMDINQRILVTYNGNDGIPFAFPSDYTSLNANTELSQAQVNDLLYDAPYALDTEDDIEKAANQAFGESLVEYLRGDTGNEGDDVTDFRTRNGHRLGDIVHASPVFVGDPDPDTYPDTIAASSYQAWANNPPDAEVNPGIKGRQKMLYVGANDGALHAFNADSGKEVFAYYPQAVFSDEEDFGLHWLADPNYKHRYYVDIEPALGEVYANTDGTGDAWHTLLVGGLRAGGRAIYALDVTDPSKFTDATAVSNNILWEFTDPELGYTYSKPTIVKMNDDRWAAIFGNGYNQAGEGASGEAVLFIKYLDQGTPSVRKITTGVGSIANGDCLDAGSDCNGLSTPAVVDLGADRVADRAYAGDLKGNLWVFDLSSDDAATWGVAYGTATDPAPLITANYLDGTDVRGQPITAQPIVTLHPIERHDATQPNTMVFFGTGQYMTENDPITTGTNSFYGVWDSGTALDFNRSATDPVLLEQTLTLTSSGDQQLRLLSDNPISYEAYKGWYVDLPDSGERVIVSPIV
ncbi:MAG: PilC/PilY family type IV pilus protein, partial [Chromatiales bacterium]